MWIPLALASAFLTALVGTISKSAMEKTGSVFGFAIQATFITFLAWIVVLCSGRFRTNVAQLETSSVGWLALSGVVSCIAYLCYFGALGIGDSSKVQPVDRLSLIFAIVLASLFLRERINAQIIIGAVLMSLGALVIAFAKTK